MYKIKQTHNGIFIIHHENLSSRASQKIHSAQLKLI